MAQARPTLSVVVPCYNEEGNVPALISRFKKVFSKTDSQLIFVNDGSKDGTLQALKAQTKKLGPANCLVLDKPNGGYGDALACGLRRAEGDFVAWTHADLQTDPSDVQKALKLIQSRKDPQATLVKGLRSNSRSKAELFFTVGMAAAATLFLQKFFWDINAQPKLFPRRFLIEVLRNPPKDFSLDLYALYKAKLAGYTIVSLPVEFGERKHGQSSWSTTWKSKSKFIWRTFCYLVQLRIRSIKGQA